MTFAHKPIIMKSSIFLLALISTTNLLLSQQIPDPDFNPVVQSPMYEPGKGSVIFIDEGHHSFHTKDRGFSPFSKVLEKDGYLIKGYMGAFERNRLINGKILVIANALNRSEE